MKNENDALINAKTSDDLSDLKKMFSNYQEKKKSSGGGYKTRENILAKYFVPRNSKEVFRILPQKSGQDRIQEAFFHVLPTLTSGGKTKHGTVLYCLAHNEPMVQKKNDDGTLALDVNGKPIMIPSPCPLCDKYHKLISKQDNSVMRVKKENLTDAQKKIKEKNLEIFKEASKWQAKKFYILRGIDRGVERDGVKFWRFKHNYKNQGTLDKLLPILEEYVTYNQADYSDAQEGTDLSITMTDSEFMGHVYKTISAITFRGKSPLHHDALTAKQWLEDDITWRDVFKPKKAPNITPYEFLEMVANGTNPYWDDSDQNNKKWVFPGRPDLEEAANNRDRDFDANKTSNIELASDLRNDGVTVSNMTESKVGKYIDNAIDLGETAEAETTKEQPKSENQNVDGSENADDDNDNNDEDYGEDAEDYDDLPF